MPNEFEQPKPVKPGDGFSARDLNQHRDMSPREIRGDGVARFGRRYSINPNSPAIPRDTELRYFVVRPFLPIEYSYYGDLIKVVPFNFSNISHIFDENFQANQDGGEDVGQSGLVYIAKPYDLQRTPFDNSEIVNYNGAHISIVFDPLYGTANHNKRTITPTVGSAYDETIQPPYFDGDVILAAKRNTGLLWPNPEPESAGSLTTRISDTDGDITIGGANHDWMEGRRAKVSWNGDSDLSHIPILWEAGEAEFRVTGAGGGVLSITGGVGDALPPVDVEVTVEILDEPVMWVDVNNAGRHWFSNPEPIFWTAAVAGIYGNPYTFGGIPSGSIYTMSFQSARWDNANFFDIAQPDKIFIRNPGWYIVTAKVYWSWPGQSNPPGGKFELGLVTNLSSWTFEGPVSQATVVASEVANNDWGQTITWMFNVDVGDLLAWIQMYVYQDTGIIWHLRNDNVNGTPTLKIAYLGQYLPP